MIHFGLSYKKYHRSIINLSKRLRVYTIVAFSFIRTFAPYFFNRINYDNKRTF